ncbi:MAG: alkaline phosphatase family protein [Clostridia bacterium]|nr:alkaline phosphatase family protein [Clostridia bacterium]
MLNIINTAIAWIVTLACFIAGIFTGTNYGDFNSKYIKNIEAVDIYENTIETAVPQTEIYNLIKNHLSSPLPEGKTAKKAIVIGYDGCRADNLKMSKEFDASGINTLIADGGQAVLSYCGGVPYPAINKQDTSTAPGWCSILTGVWADVHGVKKNHVPKSNDTLTLLTTLVEDGTVDSSAFYVSWNGHFSQDNSTYINEKKYIEEKQLNASFVKADNDDGTIANIVADVSKENCSDFIFSILEYCDHEGHSTGFSQGNKKLAAAYKDAEKASDSIISAIKSRPTYDTEDWLIIITTDHGGYNTWHGGPTIQERMTFIVCNKPVIG